MIGRSGERGLGISMLPAQHDDDDDTNPCPSDFTCQMKLKKKEETDKVKEKNLTSNTPKCILLEHWSAEKLGYIINLGIN